MKKYWLILASVAFIITAFQYSEPEAFRNVSNESFGTGEILKYRIHYGFISAAEAIMQVQDGYYDVNGRSCYKIDVFGNTTGFADVLYSVRDNFGAYVDTTSILPMQSYRYIQEGGYRKNEMVNFDHENDMATVLKLDKETRVVKDKELFPVPNNVVDIVGGYYFLRTLDYSDYDKGDVIPLEGFFDEEIYNIEVKIIGRELLRTKVGEINSIIVAPSLPENSFFENSKDPVKVWMSDDSNKVPLKIKAKLAIGAIEIDIKEMQNLRN
ncbi:MAG: DUF3108 domain-containing protein [Tunicatimonas sp.]|uniref:DUF3108 domain-containing protein n=1 Tax=Tunicatimonas sp. TaxID=1940096 RepID=UPI003C790938